MTVKPKVAKADDYLHAALRYSIAMKTKSDLGTNLRLWRERFGLTQEQLGNKLGHGKSAISRWENGERDMDSDTIIKVANALGIEPYALFRQPDNIEAAMAIDRFARLVEQIGVERAIKMLDAMNAP